MKKIVALTGAGISRASGIPTFVEMGDLRDKLSRDYFINNPKEFYSEILKMKKLIDNVEPNDAHKALSDYDVPIITMNIDGLHQKAGSKNVLEIHGNLEYVYCEKCSKKYDFNVVQNSIYCKDCKSILQPNVVLYGDMIPYYHNAIDIIGSGTHLLVVGTSFYTSTSSYFVDSAEWAGINVDIINDNAEVKVRKYLDE